MPTAASHGPGRYGPVVGLEVHCQLLTRTKLFCGCANRFGDPPNSHVCPVCLGLPGALPVLNRQAVVLALRAALATRSSIHETSLFARKNYFYPDLPKGYQISQYERPLATDGWVELAGSERRIRLQRIHIEEDAGKLLHEGFPWSADKSGIDFNRAGVPLIEIVSGPEIRSAEEAHDYLTALRTLLLYVRVSDGNMEEGSLRCDANVSIRPHGSQGLGTRVEIKNLNSFGHVRRAIQHEVVRQQAVLEAGRQVEQETRLWNAARAETLAMRGKEEAHDYRYFPEPDLQPPLVSSAWIEELRASRPVLPAARRRRFVSEHGLPEYDASLLTASRELADYFEAAAGASGNPKAASNWVMTEVLRKLNESGSAPHAPPVTRQRLGELIRMIDAGSISGRIAKDVFERMWTSGESAPAIVEREGLAQVSDEPEIQAAVDAVVASSPDQAASYRAGKAAALGWFVGQVMKRMAGKANPQLVNKLLRQALDGPGKEAGRD